MKIEETIKSILAMAKEAASVIEAVTGTNLIGPAVAAGQTILTLVDNIQETGTMSQDDIQADRERLEIAVNNHVDQAIEKLRG